VDAGNRVDDADRVPRVLQDPALLDVRLDPAREVVEDVDALAPALGLVAGLRGVLPEAPPVVDRAEVLLRSSSVTRRVMIRLPRRPTLKPEPSSSRNETSMSGRPSPSSSFSRHASSAMTTPSVPSHLPPLRFESQCEPIP
jgi:hypothetical protein